MKVNYWIIALIVLLALFIASCTKREEMFADGGALIQLAADHVPNEEDEKEEEKWGIDFF
jgi:hypothetical protein